jgi:PAS domain S-box-containing protein
MFESVEDSIFIVDVDGAGDDLGFSFYWNNPAHESATGMTVGEFRGQSPREFLNETEAAEVRGRYRECVERGEVIEYEERIEHLTGTVDWHTKLTPIFEEGAVTRLVGVARDITDRKRRERELERHRERLQALFDNAPDGIIVHDVDGNILDANDRILEDLGYTRDEFLSLEISDVEVGLEDEFLKNEWNSIAEGAMHRMEVEGVHIRKDGSTYPVEVWVSKIRPRESDTGRLIALTRDISERKEHEQRLATLHESTRRVIDAESKSAVAEIAVEAAHDLLGFSLPAVWYPTEDGTELAMVADSEDHRALLAGSGTPEPVHPRGSWLWNVCEAGETEVRHSLRPDEVAADVPLQSVIALPLGGHGVLTCASRSDEDFTDRQIEVAEILARNVRVALDQLEQRAALERQQAFTQDLLDAIEDVVYVLNPDGDLVEWNKAFEDVTGYSSEELESMNATDFFGGAEAEAAADTVEEAVETGQSRVELDFVTADGDTIPYEFIVNAFVTPDGRTVVAGIGRDRSAHAEYERRLKQQRDSLEVLNQVVRHDIRNHMTVVRGRATLVGDHLDEEGQEHLAAVHRATENAIELTKTARDLAATMLSTEDDVEPVPLDHHLEQPIETVRGAFAHAVITVDDRIPSVRVRGNDLLEAVFRNILHNAVVHNDAETPKVEVSITTDEETIGVSIADNGPGIPDDQKEDVFGRGEKGLDSPGTGVGLYLVKTLIQQYGGSVWVEDNEPEGSVFRVELPRADA